jgi:hypothetical protein
MAAGAGGIRLAGPGLLDRDVLARLPAESEAEWYARVEREVDASKAGPLALWAERKHPLVRAEARRRRRQRWLGLALLIGLPYALTAAALLFVAGHGVSKSNLNLREAAGAVSVMLAGLWPLAAILGCASMAAEAVAEERKQGTAAQLALTALPPRVLAAAKVLPYFRTAFWALAAMLPIYAAGACFLTDRWGLPSAITLTPMRLAGIERIFRFTDPQWPGGLPGSVGIAAVMFIGDVILAWAAVHWGAAWAVRHGGTTLGAGIATARVLGVLLAVGLVLGACEALCLVFRGSGLPEIVVSTVLLLAVLIKGGRWLATRSVRAALREFAGFHRLAADPDGGERWPIGR